MRVDNMTLELGRTVVIVLDREGAKRIRELPPALWMKNTVVRSETGAYLCATNWRQRIEITIMAIRAIWSSELPKVN